MRAALLLFVMGCAIGAPPGFSSGDTWTLPLIDPLADGRLLVPVMVHGRGPYIFIIDRDSPTVVDAQVASEAGARMRANIRVVDHSDTSHVAYSTELTDVEVGNLTVSLVHVVVLPHAGMFDSDGRRIHGILGRDFLADSLVFGFDRDRGVAWLKTQQAFSPPPGASTLELEKLTSDGESVKYEPVLRAQINGLAFDLHPRIGELVGQLPIERWPDAKLDAVAWDLALLDNTGQPWRVTKLGVAHQITIDGVARTGVAFAPYSDGRRIFEHVGGTLGLDFFRPYAVAADWHHGVIYMTPRQDLIASRALRTSRWGSMVPCTDAACVELELSPREETPERPVLHVRTEPEVTRDLQVTVRATSSTGEALPNIEINLPAGVHGLASPLDGRYFGAKLEILDLSPFPRQCKFVGGCVMIQAPPSPS